MQSLRVPQSCVVQTPSDLAVAMVRSLDSSPSDRWLEPCVGTGSLLKALSACGVQPRQITGLDLAQKSQPADKLGKVSRGVEFLKWSNSTKLKFNNIIANPPYIALERLHPAIRRAALGLAFSTEFGVGLDGNAWYAFLCAAIRVLESGGSLCFLLPAAWDFANYAAPLRSQIGQLFKTVRVYRSATPIFRATGIRDGSIVLIAEGFCGHREIKRSRFRAFTVSVSRHEAPDLRALLKLLVRQGNTSKPCADRGTQTAVGFPAAIPKPRSFSPTLALGSLVSIRLGVVTGDADYFLISEPQRRRLRLPSSSVCPVLSRARHLRSGFMTDVEWRKLRDEGDRVWLFNPSPRSVRHSAVKSYIRFGRKEGCNLDNHKIAIREPWYRMAVPPTIDGFISGMSKYGPWISFRSMPGLAATNTLYIVKFIDPRLPQASRLAVALSLLTSEVAEQMAQCGRRYPDGLIKFEPRDLLQIEIPVFRPNLPPVVPYMAAVEALLSGDVRSARQIADRWVAKAARLTD